jgi:peptidyl-prolyl cis-trans isomerase B (cyclophilin B)
VRRLLPFLLAAVLLLAACGDNEDTAGGGGGTDAATQTAPPATAETASGCVPAEEPEAREVRDRERPSFRVRSGRAYTAVVETNCGTLTIRLAASRAPRTVSSFVALARDGFYDGLAFHRIVPGFVIQGGDPAGSGQGGPGYEVVEAPPSDVTYDRGTVAMAKTELDEPGTSGSQFFVVTADDAGLPAEYALLGKVVEGDAALDRLGNAPNDPADNRPTEPIVIQKVTIREADA